MLIIPRNHRFLTRIHAFFCKLVVTHVYYLGGGSNSGFTLTLYRGGRRLSDWGMPAPWGTRSTPVLYGWGASACSLRELRRQRGSTPSVVAFAKRMVGSCRLCSCSPKRVLLRRRFVSSRLRSQGGLLWGSRPSLEKVRIKRSTCDLWTALRILATASWSCNRPCSSDSARK